MDLAIATCLTLPEPDADEAPLRAALTARELSFEYLAWDDPGVDWSRAPLVLIRSTWNYPAAPEAFLAWAERVGDRLWNPLPVVRWNMHKSYLLALAEAGLPVVPTRLVPRGARTRLAEVAAASGFTAIVAKPAISAGSFSTRRFDAAPDESWFADCLAARDMLVQPFVRSVDGYGERSLVWVDGELTHAVRKSPRFDGSDESISEAMPIADDERAFAVRALALAEATTGHRPRYARVDLARDDRGDPMLMELELIEPSLFFRQGPAALARLVDLLVRTCA